MSGPRGDMSAGKLHRSKRVALTMVIASATTLSGVAMAVDPASSGAPTGNGWAISETSNSIKVPVPPNAKPEKEEKLPTIDISMVAGLKVLLRRGVAWGTPEEIEQGHNRVLAVCARAPSSAWSPGAEELVFSKMNEMIRDELQKRGPVDGGVQEGLNEETARGYYQVAKSHTQATTSKPGLSVEARHMIAFVGEKSDVLACTAVCSEKTSDNGFCSQVSAQASIEGPVMSPPKGSFGARLSVGLARHPVGAVGVVVGALMMFAGLVVFGLGLRSPAAPSPATNTDDEEE
ncbi:MAG: hypothetical protein U0165_17115 [Polyangiaceae bacterium]